jgi:hypothetical protein
LFSGSNPTGNPPPVLTVAPLFVSKWIDYSNKYGFGFQLSDKSVGVLFNDSTRISFTPDRRSVLKVKSHIHLSTRLGQFPISGQVNSWGESSKNVGMCCCVAIVPEEKTSEKSHPVCYIKL